MPTVLTTPQVIKAITHATVDGWSLVLKRRPDLSVVVDESEFIANIQLRDQQGGVAQTEIIKLQANQLPPALAAAAVAFHEAVIATARAANKLPPGTDTEDF